MEITEDPDINIVGHLPFRGRPLPLHMTTGVYRVEPEFNIYNRRYQ